MVCERQANSNAGIKGGITAGRCFNLRTAFGLCCDHSAKLRAHISAATMPSAPRAGYPSLDTVRMRPVLRYPTTAIASVIDAATASSSGRSSPAAQARR